MYREPKREFFLSATLVPKQQPFLGQPSRNIGTIVARAVGLAVDSSSGKFWADRRGVMKLLVLVATMAGGAATLLMEPVGQHCPVAYEGTSIEFTMGMLLVGSRGMVQGLNASCDVVFEKMGQDPTSVADLTMADGCQVQCCMHSDEDDKAMSTTELVSFSVCNNEKPSLNKAVYTTDMSRRHVIRITGTEDVEVLAVFNDCFASDIVELGDSTVLVSCSGLGVSRDRIDPMEDDYFPEDAVVSTPLQRLVIDDDIDIVIPLPPSIVPGVSSLQGATSLALAPEGDLLFVANAVVGDEVHGNSIVALTSKDGWVSTKIQVEWPNVCAPNYPSDLALDESTGDLYVACFKNDGPATSSVNVIRNATAIVRAHTSITFSDLLRRTPEVSIFDNMVADLGGVSSLRNSTLDLQTCFVPVDDAFLDLKFLDAVFDTPDALADLFFSHLKPGDAMAPTKSDDVDSFGGDDDDALLTTLHGKMIEPHKHPTAILRSVYTSDNVIAHIVDNVLLPPAYQELSSSSSSSSSKK